MGNWGLTPGSVHVIEASEGEIMDRLVICATYQEQSLQLGQNEIHVIWVLARRWHIVDDMTLWIQVPFVWIRKERQCVFNVQTMVDIWFIEGIVPNEIIIPSRLRHDDSVRRCPRNRVIARREGVVSMELGMFQSRHGQYVFGRVIHDL
jgi:hypothetical protein